MATIGGDFSEVRVSHPTLGDHVFYPKSNEGNPRDPGGFRTSDDANMVSGDGEPIWQMNQVRGSIEVVCADDVNTREDSDFASQLAGDPTPADWIFSHISGVTWGMNGKPVGDIQPDSNAGTFTMKIAGTKPVKIVG